MDRPQYLKWIVKEDGVVLEDQQPLNCYRLSYFSLNAGRRFPGEVKTLRWSPPGKPRTPRAGGAYHAAHPPVTPAMSG